MSSTKTESTWLAQLLRRAGFGYTPKEFKYYQSLGYDETLDELLHPQKVDNSPLEKAISDQTFDFTNTADLKRWWLYRMTYTRRPLEEKMTLFLHGHFATSDRKVRNTHAMYLQNLLFRKYALGDFQQLLVNISKDPAMIVWLDNQQNRKGKPNENYAREIMELFTLGIGNYTEADIKESAKAFTGWQTNPSGYYFNRGQHDFTAKTFLGNTGNFNGEDIVAILAGRPATAHFMAKKLITFFAYDDPDKSFVEKVATAYKTNNHSLGAMLKVIFTDRSFKSDRAYHAKIKSPAELVVGTIKTLQLEQLDIDLPQVMASMGQDLFQPPSVKGWDGGAAWISSDTMMERFNFAARISSTRLDELTARAKPSELVDKYALRDAQQLVNYFVDLLVDGDVPKVTRDRLIEYVSTDLNGTKTGMIEDNSTLNAKLRGLIHLIMTLPTYQLT